jgi:hypothetical protein
MKHSLLQMAVGGDELRSAPRKHFVCSIELRGRFQPGTMRFLDRDDGFGEENGGAPDHLVSGDQGYAGRNQLSEGGLVKAGQIQCLHPQGDGLPSQPMRLRHAQIRPLLQMFLQGGMVSLRQRRPITAHVVEVFGLLLSRALKIQFRHRETRIPVSLSDDFIDWAIG